MSFRTLIPLTSIALLAYLAFPAAAGSRLEGSWQIISAEPALPEVRGHRGAIRFTPNPAHLAANGPDASYDFILSGACNVISGYLEIVAGLPSFKADKRTAQVCRDEREMFDKDFSRTIFSAQTVVRTHDRLIFTSNGARLVFEHGP